MDIRLGKPVMSDDGRQVGTVDRLVLDPDTKHVVEIIVHQGFLLTRDRIVEEDFIARVDEDGTVHLSIPADKVDDLPTFIERAYIVPTAAEVREMPYPSGGGVAAPGEVMPLLWRSSYAGHGYRVSHRSLLESSAVDTPTFVVQSNIPEYLVTLSRGTDVISSDGHKIGQVDDIVEDAEGQVTAIIVRAGVFFHHDVRVPAEWIATIGSEDVRLNVTAEQVGEHGRMPVTS